MKALQYLKLDVDLLIHNHQIRWQVERSVTQSALNLNCYEDFMDIERLLELEKWQDNEKQFLEMIISNRISHYLGDNEGGAAVGSENFGLLAEDILRWRDSKAS